MLNETFSHNIVLFANEKNEQPFMIGRFEKSKIKN
jgi:hypothetical protein